MIIGAADNEPDEREREQLRDARDEIEQMRAFASSMKRYANGYGTAVKRLAFSDMYDNRGRLDYYRRANEAFKSASAWLSEPSENRSVPLKQLLKQLLSRLH